MRRVFVATVLAFALATPAAAQDAVKGKQQFGQCGICHTLGKGEADKQGPNLHGVMGKKAGVNRKGFPYSAALKASGITWTAETLDAYIKSPARTVPKGTMAFVGVSRPDTRQNIIAYMIQATK